VVSPNVKGILYLEAYEQSHVIAAIQNMELICGIAMLEQEPIPINEMLDILSVIRKQKIHLKAKQWVRVKKGIYKNDIAQVISDYIYAEQDEVHLKLIPRIDYTRSHDTLRITQNESQALKRPTAKPFNAKAIRAIGGEVTSDGDFFIFEGNTYSYEGLV